MLKRRGNLNIWTSFFVQPYDGCEYGLARLFFGPFKQLVAEGCCYGEDGKPMQFSVTILPKKRCTSKWYFAEDKRVCK